MNLRTLPANNFEVTLAVFVTSSLLFCFFMEIMPVTLDNYPDFLVCDEADEDAEIYRMPSNQVLRGNDDIACSFIGRARLRDLDQLLFVAVLGPHKRREHNLLNGTATEASGRVNKAAPYTFELGLPESGHTRHADGGSAILREIPEECRFAFEVGARGFFIDPRKIDPKPFHPIVAGEIFSESEPRIQAGQPTRGDGYALLMVS